MDREIRAIPAEFRIQQKENEPLKIIGYAARFNELSEEMWGMREKIAPGAFTEAIGKSDVRALWNHDPNYVLGRTKNGTLQIREDEQGLFYEVTPPDAQWARDLVESIKRGDVDQSSFAFTVDVEQWDESGNPVVRTIVKVRELYDVSPVTYPAYPTATSGVRSLGDVAKEHKAAPAPKAPEHLRDKLKFLEV
ncbi:MAG: Caudovirus prohead protease [Deltaproteobacteria bacterium ADurb.Bin072]|nr:MAG: Caudovirus prohead protease [Deltaproteobacteria bacterium ADurb.Bin072]